MGEFLDKATDLYRAGRTGDARRHFETVFAAVGALQQVHSKARLDITNIESIFAAFEFAKIVRSFCGYSADQIDGLAHSAKHLITQTIEETLQFPVRDGAVFAPQPYESFAKLVDRMMIAASPAHDVVVITFNYDFALDFAFRNHRAGLDYGFGDRRTHADALPVLKLHGSVSWVTCSQCRKIRTLSYADYMKHRRVPIGGEKLKLAFSAQLSEEACCGYKMIPEAVIVPPTWNKSNYHETLSAVWATAARELSDADNVFVVGYSLPDTDVFFRYLYALGTVGKRPLERFWLFDPDRAGVVRSRFEALLGVGAEQRFQFHQAIFSNALPVIEKELKIPRTAAG